MTGIVTIIIIFSFNKSHKIIIVPKVINMDFSRAYKILHSKGFNVDIELKKFNNIPKDIVAFQSIQEEKKVKKGRKINLVVSTGENNISDNELDLSSTFNSYVIKFKLPENYSEGHVKILISDNKVTDKVVFNDTVTKATNILIPVKIDGNGIQKIYINDNFYIEKDIRE